MAWFVIGLISLLAAGSVFLIWEFYRRNLNRWLLPYLVEAPKRRSPRRDEDVHLLLCIADHFEPKHGVLSPSLAQARVDRWVREYPQLFGNFRDSDGRPPRHTFFYPMETYEEAHIDALSELCQAGFGEVEVHLHHEGDSAESLRRKLLAYKRLLAERHGLLCRHRDTGGVYYGFVHGDWALDNSGPRGRHCGVNNELDILHTTGCYADFTLPSAPAAAQTRKINSIYYATGRPQRSKAHNSGLDVGAGPRPPKGLLLIQGPLLLDWQRRKAGLVPRIENGCFQENQPPSLERVDLWLKARVQVPHRPDWFFVKLYSHGGTEANQRVLLGDPMVGFHTALAERARRDATFHFHYVTAREMCNLVLAAEAGWTGSVAQALDYVFSWNGCRPKAVEAASKIRVAH